MRHVVRRVDEKCPEQARETAARASMWGCPPVRVLDRHGDHLGWRAGGTTSLVVYDRDPYQTVSIIRPARLLELPEGEGAVI